MYIHFTLPLRENHVSFFFFFFEKIKEKQTFYNNTVDIASHFTFGKLFVHTGVATRVIHGQFANGDGVVLQRAFCLNPVIVSHAQGDFVLWLWLRVIVKHRLLFLTMSIQIHPIIIVDTGETSCIGTLQGDALARLSVHYSVLCHGRDTVW